MKGLFLWKSVTAIIWSLTAEINASSHALNNQAGFNSPESLWNTSEEQTSGLFEDSSKEVCFHILEKKVYAPQRLVRDPNESSSIWLIQPHSSSFYPHQSFYSFSWCACAAFKRPSSAFAAFCYLVSKGMLLFSTQLLWSCAWSVPELLSAPWPPWLLWHRVGMVFLCRLTWV